MSALGIERDRRELPAAELLREPITALIGVPENVAVALATMRIATVLRSGHFQCLRRRHPVWW